MDKQTLTKQLQSGIEAVRSGKKKEAREALREVIKHDPDNIPAMLWLAFVAPTYQESIHLLERVLAIEPENKHAQAGLQWAKEQMAQSSEEKAEQATSEETEDSEDSEDFQKQSIEELSSLDGKTLRKKLISKDIQEQAKKGVLAHRARRTFDPLTVIMVLIGLGTILSLTLGVLLFVPVEVGAWLPQSAEPAPDYPPIHFTPVPLAREGSGEAQLSSPEAETIPGQDGSISPANIDAEVSEEAATSAAILPLQGPNLASIEPSHLKGPAHTNLIEGFPVDSSLLAYQPAYPGEKWIEVNVTTQEVIAWEGNIPVLTFDASTGLPNTPTVLGQFNIYWKLESALMTGADYYLPDVPYTMYFYGGYGLHGAYWHNNFGQPMSHGCVNLNLDNAKKLFDWAGPDLPAGQTEVVASVDNPGTVVVVHQ